MPMTRRVVALSLFVLAACGGSGASPGRDSAGSGVDALLPASNQVSGWTRSEAVRILPADKAGQGYADGGVDGDAERFIADGLVTLGIGKYKTAGTEKLELRVWYMGTAAAASTCWTDLTTNDARYKGSNWSAVDVGAAGRLQDTGTYWWVVSRKGAYVAEVTLEPDDPAQRQVAIDFLKAVLANVP
jgi:hypothetical protein